MQSRTRIRVIAAGFLIAFLAIFGRLGQFAWEEPYEARYIHQTAPIGRPSIVDRNGQALALDVPSSSFYVEPDRIADIDETVERLIAIFPDLDVRRLYQRLQNRRSFAWIKRHITPAQEQAIWDSGITAAGFQREKRRIYPNGALAAHVLGAVDIDNTGIMGIEKWIDNQGLAALRQAGLDTASQNLQPVELSIDIRVQYALESELKKAIERYHATAGAGLILNVTNGEILALASIPDFDPNDASGGLNSDRFNRITAGVFEMGSTFKALTAAMALESGRFTLQSVIDASQPLSFGRFKIHDYQGKYRPLTLPEAFIYSSNISMGKMALAMGSEKQRSFLDKFGLISRLRTELPESAAPILPRRWGEVETATVSFGHGIAVTPLQASMAVAALVNGGALIRPTFIRGAPLNERLLRQNLIKTATGDAIRQLLQLNSTVGSARKANVAGYAIGGKTGTAEKVVNGRYVEELVMTSFMGIVPIDKPKYLILTVLDEPKGLPETYGFRTAGWNAVPVGSSVFSRVLPLLGEPPSLDVQPGPF